MSYGGGENATSEALHEVISNYAFSRPPDLTERECKFGVDSNNRMAIVENEY